MDAVWVDEVYIGTAKSQDTWTYSKLCAGIENVSFAENAQNQQYFFLCKNGFATNKVTGAAPALTISGRRIVGDTAQDYVASKQGTVGDARDSSIKLISGGKQIICDCTLSDIISFGGQSLDVNAFGVTVLFNGEPTITDVA